MRSAHISRRRAEASCDGFDWDDVSAVQEAAALSFERMEIDRDAELDRLAQTTELELTEDEQAAMYAFLHGFNDARRTHRSRRRSGREVLRSLPVQVQANTFDGEAA
ncbi:hypothetical protein [Amycolatopsis sp. YIM 10]|uniref:hypothetical protein n=1 Tax=Amycolatopsis sp. YIM 10 TaxID=2653857 RepID=UPI0012901A93|nr:hypothetical protein [Amycolatopsis sp. YIM 10]QFU94077.1 hypothetical protein YIM_44730 [Amycolatopsis sp. YIM 10]